VSALRAVDDLTVDQIPWGGADDEDRRPQIDARDQDLARVTEQTIAALQQANHPPVLFRFAGVPSRIECDTQGPMPVIVPLDAYRVRYHGQRAARWTRTSRTGKEMPATMPLDVARDILAATSWPFPILTRIVRVPVFTADGKLCARAGHHPSGVYYAPAEDFVLLSLSPTPTATDVAGAVALIDELLIDFPIVDQPSRAHLIAAFVQPYVRDLIDGPTPLFLITKPCPGTGASLLAEMLLWPALGQSPAKIAVGHGQESELQKAITATLRQSPTAVLLDNVVTLTSPALADALTSVTWDDRELGASKMLSVPVRTLWISTANNPTFSDDLNRRCVRIRLDSGLEHPELRASFRHPGLRAWVQAQRAALVHAALTLGQSWLAAGRPPGEKTIGSYESWARCLGGILQHAGVDGFLGNYGDFTATADTDASTWHAFVERWADMHGTTPVQAADLWSLASDLDLGDGNERSQRIRLGKALMRQRDRIFSGYQIAAAGEFRRLQLWRLQTIGAVR
jgi:putative DNA primase/helicase